MDEWNPELYETGYSFVWEFGRSLVQLLAPGPGPRILDLGCGTGQLTAEIARAGADVVGVDQSPAMIGQARSHFPQLRFELGDATALPYREEFDAVFSNAALHWVANADAAAAGIARALKPGGRFVAEFGGRGNLRLLLEQLFTTLEEFGVPNPRRLVPWYFPSIGEYAPLLERNGLMVTFASLFERPTPLQGGRDALAQWFEMFGKCFTDPLAPAERPLFLRQVEERAARYLLKGGVWTADYSRLRIAAVKPP